MDVVSGLINLVFFILLIYLVSWFARKMHKIESRIVDINNKIEKIIKDDKDK